MQITRRYARNLYWLAAGIFALAACHCRAASVEVDWDSVNSFYVSYVTINAGDEVDFVNLDDIFTLDLTGNPPESFYVPIKPFDGQYYYYYPHVYHNPGSFTALDQNYNYVYITVNSTVATPLSVAITDPASNSVFTMPATFSVTAVPSGGTTPYQQVNFFVGTNFTGVAYASPFTATVTNLPVGNYTISAVVTDSSFNTATDSIPVSVTVPVATNYILPAACADIYSSGNVVTGSYLDTGANIHGGLEFAAFNASQYSSILLELNPYALPLDGTNVSVYGFDGGNGTLYGTNFNSGTLIGVWTLPAGLGYGQIATFDITGFVKSVKGPYFGIILVADPDTFSSTSINYGTPPELFALTSLWPPALTAAPSGKQIVISWPTNYSTGFSLESATDLGGSATWSPVILTPTPIGDQWVVTNPISGGRQFFRLTSP